MGSGGGPLSVLDDHSRYALALETRQTTQARGVQAVLERVFRPAELRRMLKWITARPGSTRKVAWLESIYGVLMDQDVSLRFSGYQHPQTQGKVERSSQSDRGPVAPGHARGQRTAKLAETTFARNTTVCVR